MIKWLFKYGAVIFIFNTTLLAIEATYQLGDIIFLGFLSIFLLILLISPNQIKYVVFHKAFRFFLLLNIINVLYWLFFHSFSDYEALKYLLARGLQFSIISFSIYYHFEYYKSKFLDHLVYLIFAIVLISLVYNPFIFSVRYSGIMWNTNAFASFSIIGFSALLLNYKKKTKFDYFLLFLFLVISLSTGSRGVLVGIPLAFIFKYGFSVRNIAYALFAISAYLVIITIQLDTSVNRFAEQSLFYDRLLQYQYAYETLIQKPFFGFGLDKYAFINPEIIPDLLIGRKISAHNGYLAILVQYGIVFGFLVLVIIFRQSFLFFNKVTIKNPEDKFYIYLLAYTLIAAVYEALMTGINEFQTILFWFALAFLSYSKFRKANAI